MNDAMTGLRQRIAAAGITVASSVMSGSQWRGDLVGSVPSYTVVLNRDDGRTMSVDMATGMVPYEPTPFDVLDTLLVCTSLVLDEGIGGTAQAKTEIENTRRFLEGPDTWEAWRYLTDRDPGRQADYDEPEEEQPTVCPQCGATDAEGEGKLDGMLEPFQDERGSGWQCLNPECQWMGTPETT